MTTDIDPEALVDCGCCNGAGRVPRDFLPLQSGVGNIANAVLGALGANPDIPTFEMYSEVIQDSVIDLISAGKIRFATGTSLTIGKEKLTAFYDNLEFFRPCILLRPQEITNNPEVIRSPGVTATSPAVESISPESIFKNVDFPEPLAPISP